MTHFRDTSEFRPTIATAADRLGLSPTAVEKDYWVTEVLRSLAAEFENDFIFKGGTSLSKGYGIIERFSEDIDILVLPGNRGRRSVDRLMKDMAAMAASHVQGQHNSEGGAETGRHRSYLMQYPSTYDSTELIKASVLLEMGVRGDPEPHEKVSIGSILREILIAEGASIDEFEDLTMFSVRVLHPARTLLEKLDHILRLSDELDSDPEMRPPLRAARHFYDVFQLLDLEQVHVMLTDSSQIMKIIDSIDDVDRRFFGRSNDEPTQASRSFADCSAFQPDTTSSARLEESYELTMPELYFGNDPLPTWSDICARVTEHEALLKFVRGD